jgi:hypothetical protein
MSADIVVGVRLPDGSWPVAVRESNGVKVPDALRPRVVASLAEVRQLAETIDGLGAGQATVTFQDGKGRNAELIARAGAAVEPHGCPAG